jgi:hypothetical protein
VRVDDSQSKSVNAQHCSGVASAPRSATRVTRECLAIKVARKLNSMDVIEMLADLFLLPGVPPI